MPPDGDEHPPEQRARAVRPRDRLGRPLALGAVGSDPLVVGTAPRTPSAALDEAQRLLDAGLPFHAHEVLEEQWKGSPAPERELWRGLAQLAVGVTHAARGNQRGAVALLRRGAAAVTPYAPGDPFGLDVQALLTWSERALEDVRNGAAPASPPLRPG